MKEKKDKEAAEAEERRKENMTVTLEKEGNVVDRGVL